MTPSWSRVAAKAAREAEKSLARLEAMYDVVEPLPAEAKKHADAAGRHWRRTLRHVTRAEAARAKAHRHHTTVGQMNKKLSPKTLKEWNAAKDAVKTAQEARKEAYQSRLGAEKAVREILRHVPRVFGALTRVRADFDRAEASAVLAAQHEKAKRRSHASQQASIAKRSGRSAAQKEKIGRKAAEAIVGFAKEASAADTAGGKALKKAQSAMEKAQAAAKKAAEIQKKLR